MQPVPLAAPVSPEYSEDIITQAASMIHFLNLQRMFAGAGDSYMPAA